MTVFVEIAVSVPQISGLFDYHLPPELETQKIVGRLVTVPFGRQTVQGIVLRKVENPAVPETRPVLSLVDPEAVLTQHQIELAQAISEQTLAPLSACIDLMLPPGLAQRADILYSVSETVSQNIQSQKGLNEIQVKLLSLLQKRGALSKTQVEHALPRLNWEPAMRALAKHGLVTTQSILPPPKVSPKFVRTVQLVCSPEAAGRAMPALARPGSKALARRQAILRFLIREANPVDVTWAYAESGGNLQDLVALMELDLVTLGETEVWRDPLQQFDYQPSQPPELTKDQKIAWETILQQLRKAASGAQVLPILLHGVTGSGKTEIYLHAVQEALEAGKQAIILVPEIALTPQTLRRFANRFPGKIGLLHSRLSKGERYDTWRRARNGSLSVVVGPRSALFTPFPNLGLIVVDECHDDSYYQADMLPYYHASRAAITYARVSGAVCILGSATPDIGMTYQASQGHLSYLHLPERILAHRETIRAQVNRARLSTSQYHALEGEAETIELPDVRIVDMRQELQMGNRSIFSQALQDALGEIFRHKQQAILFLNRRGSATYIFCRECGHALRCPNCDLPLTYHLEQTQATLHCHYCGYQRKLPASCPACGSRQIRHYGSGTERVEAELVKLFPEARPLRWDHETTRQKGAHEVILGHFAAQRANVLIGTQMIAKGLDLPMVTLVGVILADVGLNLPDYRAAERTFQILTQVAGRAGRSPLGGQALLQTFQPDHYVIQAAAQHSYREFYKRELAYRKRLGYPPYSRLVRLEYQHSDAKEAERAARKLAAEIRTWMASCNDNATEMVGPAPCFFQRLAGRYRWQIVLRGPNPLLLLKDRSLTEWKTEVNPPNLL